MLVTYNIAYSSTSVAPYATRLLAAHRRCRLSAVLRSSSLVNPGGVGSGGDDGVRGAPSGIVS